MMLPEDHRGQEVCATELTRAGPAKSLGLMDRGHLGVGASADITVYEDLPDREAMFEKPVFVFKNGEVIVRGGTIVHVTQGATHVARPDFHKGIEKSLQSYFDRFHTAALSNIKLSDDEIINSGQGSVVVQPTAARV